MLAGIEQEASERYLCHCRFDTELYLVSANPKKASCNTYVANHQG